MLRIYFMLKSQYLKTAMEYKFNFWMMFAAGILMRTLMMGVAFVLFRSMPTIAGFTEGEVYFIMALMFVSEGLCNLLFDGIWYIPPMIFNGNLDVILSRPVSPLFQVLSHELGLQGVGVITMGIVSLVLSVMSAGFATPWAIPLCLLFMVTSTVLRMSLYLIGSSGAFYIHTGGQFNIPFTLYSIGEYAKYPVNIYPFWMQGVLYSIIPFAFIGYVPALIMRSTHGVWLTLLLIAVSVAYFFIARAVFYRGIKRYESMGM